VVTGEYVLLNGSHNGDMSLLAFHRKTGDLAWQKDRPKGSSQWAGVWSTPVVSGPEDDRQVIVVGGDRVAAYSLAKGTERWHVRGLPALSNSTPTVGDGMVFLTLTNPVGDPQNLVALPTFDELLKKYDKNKDGKISKDEIPEDFRLVDRGRPDKLGNFGSLRGVLNSFDKNKDGALDGQEWEALIAFNAKYAGTIHLTAVGIRLDGKGDVSGTHVAWRESKGVPEVPSPLYYEGLVYLVSERGFVSCRDAATGKVLYRTRLPAQGVCYSSPIAADGRIYTATDSGGVVVFKAGARFVVLETNELGEAIFATPAIVDGCLYVRTEKHLCAFGERRCLTPSK
jgi:outer membrane protein assembly factor BamB